MLVRNSQRPSKVIEFVENNEPESVYGTSGDTWKKYLNNNGGTGDTFHDLERSYSTSKGGIGATLADLWGSIVGGVGALRDRLRNYLQSILASNSSFYVQEDGVSKYKLEDGSGSYILE